MDDSGWAGRERQGRLCSVLRSPVFPLTFGALKALAATFGVLIDDMLPPKKVR
jgi:hypothetical protein